MTSMARTTTKTEKSTTRMVRITKKTTTKMTTKRITMAKTRTMARMVKTTKKTMTKMTKTTIKTTTKMTTEKIMMAKTKTTARTIKITTKMTRTTTKTMTRRTKMMKKIPLIHLVVVLISGASLVKNKPIEDHFKSPNFQQATRKSENVNTAHIYHFCNIVFSNVFFSNKNN